MIYGWGAHRACRARSPAPLPWREGCYLEVFCKQRHIGASSRHGSADPQPGVAAVRERRSTSRTNMTRQIEAGYYEQKQLASKSKVIAWSHSARFEVAKALLAPLAGGRLLDYGSGD